MVVHLADMMVWAAYDADARSVGLSSSDEADPGSSSGDSGGDDGGRHCCTVLVKRKNMENETPKRSWCLG